MFCLTSDGYTNKEIRYEWEKEDSNVYIHRQATLLPQYNISSFKPEVTEEKVYVAGTSSLLRYIVTVRYSTYVTFPPPHLGPFP